MTRDPRSRKAAQWWRQLDLTFHNELWGVTENERRVHAAYRQVLEQVVPRWFEVVDGPAKGERLSIETLAEWARTAAEVMQEKIQTEHEERRALGWSRIEAAYAADDADVVITKGTWAGFTRARATAWLWNLTQYEPFQFTGVFAQQRVQREQALAAGEIPEVETYSHKARKYEEGGLTPHTYRVAQEALGKKPFTPDEVSQGRPCTCGR